MSQESFVHDVFAVFADTRLPVHGESVLEQFLCAFLVHRRHLLIRPTIRQMQRQPRTKPPGTRFPTPSTRGGGHRQNLFGALHHTLRVRRHHTETVHHASSQTRHITSHNLRIKNNPIRL
jgi:hypothetical protein